MGRLFFKLLYHTDATFIPSRIIKQGRMLVYKWEKTWLPFSSAAHQPGEFRHMTSRLWVSASSSLSRGWWLLTPTPSHSLWITTTRLFIFDQPFSRKNVSCQCLTQRKYLNTESWVHYFHLVLNCFSLYSIKNASSSGLGQTPHPPQSMAWSFSSTDFLL